MGTVAVIIVLVSMAIFLLNGHMKIGSLLENRNIEKRVAITPDVKEVYHTWV